MTVKDTSAYSPRNEKKRAKRENRLEITSAIFIFLLLGMRISYDFGHGIKIWDTIFYIIAISLAIDFLLFLIFASLDLFHFLQKRRKKEESPEI